MATKFISAVNLKVGMVIYRQAKIQNRARTITRVELREGRYVRWYYAPGRDECGMGGLSIEQANNPVFFVEVDA